MTKLYVDEISSSQFAICFNDASGVRQIHQEDFKPQVFGSAAEASAVLASLAAERAREDAAVPLSLTEAADFALGLRWKFATTYAKTAPHEYIVKKWLSPADQLLFERFVQTMKHNSVVGYFYGHKNDYLILNTHYYWYMGQYENRAINLINRTAVDHLVLESGVYQYKP